MGFTKNNKATFAQLNGFNLQQFPAGPHFHHYMHNGPAPINQQIPRSHGVGYQGPQMRSPPNAPAKMLSHNRQDNGDATVVYLGGLTSEATEDSLRQLMSQFGPITSVAIRQGISARGPSSHWYAFVRYKNVEAVQAALRASEVAYGGRLLSIRARGKPINRHRQTPEMHQTGFTDHAGQQILNMVNHGPTDGSRNISISSVRSGAGDNTDTTPKTPQSLPAMNGPVQINGAPVLMSKALTVANLPPDMNNSELCHLFAQIGPVEGGAIHDFLDHLGRRCAQVSMETFYWAQKAVEQLNGINIRGHALDVSYQKTHVQPRAVSVAPVDARMGHPGQHMGPMMGYHGMQMPAFHGNGFNGHRHGHQVPMGFMSPPPGLPIPINHPMHMAQAQMGPPMPIGLDMYGQPIFAHMGGSPPMPFVQMNQMNQMSSPVPVSAGPYMGFTEPYVPAPAVEQQAQQTVQHPLTPPRENADVEGMMACTRTTTHDTDVTQSGSAAATEGSMSNAQASSVKNSNDGQPVLFMDGPLDIPDPAHPEDPNNLFVKNICEKAINSTEKFLEFMSQFGKVTSIVLNTFPSGQSKCAGFVRFNTKEEAGACRFALNNKIPPGGRKALQVYIAETKEVRERRIAAYRMGSPEPVPSPEKKMVTPPPGEIIGTIKRADGALMEKWQTDAGIVIMLPEMVPKKQDEETESKTSVDKTENKLDHQNKPQTVDMGSKSSGTDDVRSKTPATATEVEKMSPRSTAPTEPEPTAGWNPSLAKIDEVSDEDKKSVASATVDSAEVDKSKSGTSILIEADNNVDTSKSEKTVAPKENTKVASNKVANNKTGKKKPAKKSNAPKHATPSEKANKTLKTEKSDKVEKPKTEASTPISNKSVVEKKPESAQTNKPVAESSNGSSNHFKKKSTNRNRKPKGKSSAASVAAH